MKGGGRFWEKEREGKKGEFSFDDFHEISSISIKGRGSGLDKERKGRVVPTLREGRSSRACCTLLY